MAAGAWRIGALDAPRHRRWLAQDAARCGVRAVQLYGDGGGGGCRLLASRVSNNRTRRHTGHWGPMNGDGGGRSMHGDGAGSRLSLESRTTGGGGARGWNLEVASGVRVLTRLWRVGVGQNFGFAAAFALSRVAVPRIPRPNLVELLAAPTPRSPRSGGAWLQHP